MKSLTRIALTGEQIEQIEADQPAGCVAIVFGAMVYGDFPQPRPANLVFGWVAPEEAQAGLQAAGIAAIGDLEKRRIKRAKTKTAKKKTVSK